MLSAPVSSLRQPPASALDRPRRRAYDRAVNLDRLRILQAVARHGTFAAAAEALSFTPSAVSQQMARLEQEAGSVLVERTPRGIVLTEAGHALVARADEILALTERARHELEGLRRASAGRLRFGSFPTATQSLSTRALRLLRHRHPDLEVTLVDDEPHGLLARLAERTLDLAVVFKLAGRSIGRDYRQQLVADEEAAELTPLFEDPYVLVVPEPHPLARAEAVDAEALAAETLIGHRLTPGLELLEERCRRQGVELRFSSHAIADYVTVRALVAAGEGVAAVPRLACALPYPGTVTVGLGELAPSREVLLAVAAGAAPTPPARAMAEVLRELTTEPKLASLAA